MTATARCAVLVGVDAVPVRVEVDVVGQKSPRQSWTFVGLAERAARESQIRIRSALKSCGYPLPAGRITVSLTPADVPKNSSSFDLAIALALLARAGVLPAAALREYLVVGELNLNGELYPVRGTLAYARLAQQSSAKEGGKLLVPAMMAPQAAAVPRLEVFGAEDLPSVVAFLRGEQPLLPPGTAWRRQDGGLDLSDVRGQDGARRVLEIAAAGGHNLLLTGAPGAGKSMLASRLPSILPPLSPEESLETSTIWSVAGLLAADQMALLEERPLRAPHHTASDVGLVGGGVSPRPGELSLAHNGVLFLDGLPEFRRSVLEALRQPLEQGHVVIVRARHRVTFPAKVQLVATMNPCPCGMLDERQRSLCSCGIEQIRRYWARIPRPLLDRIDLHAGVTSMTRDQLRATPYGESSVAVRARVLEAREQQALRYEGTPIQYNAELTPAALRLHAQLDQRALQRLARVSEQRHLSVYAFGRIRKVARTIADLEGCAQIETAHITEAIDATSVLNAM